MTPDHGRHTVSIIIPTYNYGKYLTKAIKSCLDQTHKELEIIVVDDGSTDDTREIVGQLPDIVYIFHENQGVSTARNTGLNLAKGEFIVFLDADDYLLEDSITTRIDVFRRHPDVGVVFTDTYSENSEGRLTEKEKNRKDIISKRFYEDLLLKHLRFQTSAAMIRSEVAKRFSFVPHLSNGEDLVYFAKIFFVTKGYFCATPTVVNLHHEDSLRHDTNGLLKQNELFLAAIFDDPFYEGVIEYMRKQVTARRHLEIFRKLCQFGEGKRAKEHYMKALSIDPRALFNLNYLSKFVRFCLK
jgi:glycosyltransferase involved in cell wall biosynthesis